MILYFLVSHIDDFPVRIYRRLSFRPFIYTNVIYFPFVYHTRTLNVVQISHLWYLLGYFITPFYLSLSCITPFWTHEKSIFSDPPPLSSKNNRQVIYHTLHKSGEGIAHNTSPTAPPVELTQSNRLRSHHLTLLCRS